MPNLIGQSIGRYHIREQLGEGGMATVYKAYDTRLERNVAFKVLRTDLFGQSVLDQVLKRFEREAKSLAKLTHPSIVNILDYGEYNEMPYLVMEYLPGGTLKEKLGQQIPWQEAIQNLLPIAQGLSYAHQHNLIHRDVKPANILFTERNSPVLTDFGIAKLLEGADGHTLTASGVGIGTPEYMAPEQGIGASTIDARADIYSLGIVLYEMVTGRKPYIAETPMAVVLKQMNDPLPRPTDFVPDLPEGIERILLKSLAKEPNDRYADMDSLINAMEIALVDKQHIKSLTPTRQPRKRIASRTKTFRKLGVTLLLAVVAIVVIVLGNMIAPRIGNYINPPPANTSNQDRTPTAIPTSQWVADFAEPILFSIQDREPDFQDDFSTKKSIGWYVGAGQSIASIKDGKMQAKNEEWIFNSYLMSKPNFILQADVTLPASGSSRVLIGGGNIIYLMLYLEASEWGVCTLDCDSYQQGLGPIIQVTVIAKNTEAGIYLDGEPAYYLEDIDFSDAGKFGNIFFSCGGDVCEFDNVNFWDLDEAEVASLAPLVTPTPAPSLSPLPTLTLLPPRWSWTADFAEPILFSIRDREPDFQDDFSDYSKGWFTWEYTNPLVIEDGVLRFRGSSGVSNPYFLDKSNYVLEVEIRDRPSDLHVEPNYEYQVLLGYINSWRICKKSEMDNCPWESLPSLGQKVQIIIIVRDSKLGFYLDGTPLGYSSIYSASGYRLNFYCEDFCEFDSVKFWDLDKIPNLP